MEIYDNLSKQDCELLKEMGYEQSDFSAIDEAFARTTYTIKKSTDNQFRLITSEQAKELLGQKDFLSGLARSCFHSSASRNITVNDKYFILFEKGNSAYRDKPNTLEITATELLDNIKETRIKELLKKVAEEHSEGTIYFDYRNILEPEEIREALEEYVNVSHDYANFKDFLYDYVYEKWNLYDAELDVIDDLIKDVLTGSELEELEDYIEEKNTSANVLLLDTEGFEGVTYDIDDIIDNYDINIMLATDTERNFDMGSIGCIGNEDSLRYIDNALSYIIYQQGYTVSDVLNAYNGNTKPKDEFIKSVVEELNNHTYTMGEMTLLIQTKDMTLLGEMYNALHSPETTEKTFIVPKDTVIGIFNEWEGAGSTFGIKLQKPLEIPMEMIRNIQLDDTKYKYQYTVGDVYSFPSKAYEKGDIEFGDNTETKLMGDYTENSNKDMDAVINALTTKEQDEVEYDT